MDLTAVPAWMNEAYVETILRSDENDESIKVSNITVKAATNKGDNYLSDMYRVSIEISRVREDQEIQEERSIVIKVAPMGDIREEMITNAGVFDLEISMMVETLPRMNQLLSALGLASLSPRYLSPRQENLPIHLVFEDLLLRGYRMTDREAGLDLDHCLLAIKNLARFHASSVAVKEKDPQAFAKYTKGILHEDHPLSLKKVVTVSVKSLAHACRNWPELCPRISEKLDALSEVMFERGCEAAAYRQDDFNVLNHGDFWINNMMFRYDERHKPVGHIFVDFQICNYGSPAIDLLYFLATSTSDDVRSNHREILFREYHAELTGTMSKLRCKTEAPSFDDLQEILRRRALCEVVPTIMGLPMILLDKSEASSLNGLMTINEEGREHPAFNGTKFRNMITKLLPLYDSMGLFDD